MARFTRRTPRVRGNILKGWVRLPASWTQLRRRGSLWHKCHEKGTLCGKAVPEQGTQHSELLPPGEKPCRLCVRAMNRHENDPDRKQYRHDYYQAQRQRLREVRAQRAEREATRESGEEES